MGKEFDYEKAVAELEAIALKVEDPKTGIQDIDGCLKRADELVETCRAYLRGVREKIEEVK